MALAVPKKEAPKSEPEPVETMGQPTTNSESTSLTNHSTQNNPDRIISDNKASPKQTSETSNANDSAIPSIDGLPPA